MVHSLLQFALVPLTVGAAYDQGLRFSVPAMAVEISPTSEGQAIIDYWIMFENTAHGALIDVIDLGMPNKDYEIASMEVDVDGTPCLKIRESERSPYCVEVYLKDAAIAPGTSSGFHFRGVCEKMVRTDTKGKACIDFAPTWFNSQRVTGSTDLTIRLILPTGTNESNARYHGRAASKVQVVRDHIEYTWTIPGVWLGEPPPLVGASFPASLLSSVHQISLSDRVAESVAAFCEPVRLIGALCALVIISATLTIRHSRRKRMVYFPPACLPARQAVSSVATGDCACACAGRRGVGSGGQPS